MQNAHLRLGRLEYQRSSVKTHTHIFVHVSQYVGEGEQVHLLSYFGNDAEVAAITAAIQENHRFELTFPDGRKQRVGFGLDATCYKGNLNIPTHKKSLRHIVAVSSWLHANGGASRTFLLNEDSEDLAWATLVSLQGLPADPRWGGHILETLRQEKKLVPLDGFGCTPAVVHATRQELLERIGQACSSHTFPFPEKNGPIIWPSFEVKDAMTQSMTS